MADGNEATLAVGTVSTVYLDIEPSFSTEYLYMYGVHTCTSSVLDTHHWRAGGTKGSKYIQKTLGSVQCRACRNNSFGRFFVAVAWASSGPSILNLCSY